jgi:hypothetical protein
MFAACPRKKLCGDLVLTIVAAGAVPKPHVHPPISTRSPFTIVPLLAFRTHPGMALFLIPYMIYANFMGDPLFITFGYAFGFSLHV